MMATSPWVVRTKQPTTLPNAARRGIARRVRSRGWQSSPPPCRRNGGPVRRCTDHQHASEGRWALPLEVCMADIEWKPLPTGLWTPPAVFAEVGNLLLEAFTDGGVPTWEISKKTGERGEWNIIAKGTADSFEAAKAAALFEGGAAS